MRRGLSGQLLMQFVGLELGLRVQRGDLLRRFGPALADFPLQFGPLAGELLGRVVLGRVDQGAGLGLGPFGLPFVLLREVLGRLLGLFTIAVGLRPDALDLLLDLGEVGLGLGHALVVSLVGRLAAQAQLCFEVTRHASDLLAGVLEQFVRLRFAAGRALRGVADDCLPLLFGQGQHLLDHRAKVAESLPIDLDRPTLKLSRLGA
jgi:hypothetical protein